MLIVYQHSYVKMYTVTNKGRTSTHILARSDDMSREVVLPIVTLAEERKLFVMRCKTRTPADTGQVVPAAPFHVTSNVMNLVLVFPPSPL